MGVVLRKATPTGGAPSCRQLHAWVQMHAKLLGTQAAQGTSCACGSSCGARGKEGGCWKDLPQPLLSGP